jgi:catechol 2,3-dioxygenase-like lactoylglutathione lyase family enzyme
MEIIDHIGINVSDFERSKAFYEAALAPLGISLLMQFDRAAGLGKQKPELWLGARSSSRPIRPQR